MRLFTILMRLFNTILLLFILTEATTQSSAEVELENIVPNPGFEQYASAPIGWFYKGQHFTNTMKYWSSPTAASPDVFGPKVKVPAHWAEKGFGQQKAHKGVSMVGITAYGCGDGKPHCREYIQIQLKEPLVIGQHYYIEFWVNHLPRSLQINNLGAHFSMKRIDIKTDEILAFRPAVNAEKIITATKGRWSKISGNFKSDSEADYLIIGNFFNDQKTEVKKAAENSLPFAYYYVDDVLVRKEEPIIEVPVKPDDLTKVKLEEGKVVQLKNLYFDTDKWELLPRSYVELNKLLKILHDNPKMIIEIIGHTDNQGEDNYNLYLSRKRAKAVVDFLNENGVPAWRTRFKGLGRSTPIAVNDTDDGRQLNRRVEFLIVKM